MQTNATKPLERIEELYHMPQRLYPQSHETNPVATTPRHPKQKEK
jgi:hypothetical protein